VAEEKVVDSGDRKGATGGCNDGLIQTGNKLEVALTLFILSKTMRSPFFPFFFSFSFHSLFIFFM